MQWWKNVSYLAGQVTVTPFLLLVTTVLGPWDTSAHICITPRAHCYPALGCVSPTYFLGCAVSEAWSRGCSHFPFPHYCYYHSKQSQGVVKVGWEEEHFYLAFHSLCKPHFDLGFAYLDYSSVFKKQLYWLVVCDLWTLISIHGKSSLLSLWHRGVGSGISALSLVWVIQPVDKVKYGTSVIVLFSSCTEMFQTWQASPRCWVDVWKPFILQSMLVGFCSYSFQAKRGQGGWEGGVDRCLFQGLCGRTK